MKRTIPLVSVAIAATALLVAGPALAKPDPLRYTAKTGESKLRLGTRGGRVVGIVFHGEAVCRDEDGEIMEPYYGGGVTSAFNSAKVGENGNFLSRQHYRNRNPITHKPQPFSRSLRGNIGRREAVVNIHYKSPLHRFRGPMLTCRTGDVPFELKRVSG